MSRSRPPVRRVALYGFLGSGNLGNDASFETVLAWFREQHPDVELSCITLAPEVIEARYGVRSVSLSALAAPAARPGAERGKVGSIAAKVLGRLLDVPRSLRLAGSADAVIIPGMGVLEDSLGVVPWGLPTWMFLIAAACRLRGRRFVLLDVGSEPTRNPLTRRLFVATVRLASHVSYRDEWSAQAMRQAGGREPEAVAPDLAFAHPARAAAAPEPGLIVVGVMAYYGDGDDPVRGAGVRRDYVASMTSALVRLTDQGDRLVLVGGDRVDVDVAHEVSAAIRAARPEVAASQVVVRDVATFGELAEQMAQAEAVVASRFHNVICALRAGRPTISVGYAEKNARLMQSVDLGEYCQTIKGLDAEQLVAQLRSVRAGGVTFADRIAGVTQGHITEVKSLLDRVSVETLGLARATRRVGS